MGLVMKTGKPTIGKRGKKGHFVTLKSGRVIFISAGRKQRWADVKEKVLSEAGRAEEEAGAMETPHLTEEWDRAVDQNVDDAFSKSADMQEAFDSPEEYKEWATDMAKGLVEGSEGISICMPFDALDEVVRDDKIKNSFDKEIVGEQIDRHEEYMQTRRDLDAGMYGIANDAPADARPIYGFLHPPDTSDAEVADMGYGGAVIRLKDDVKGRSTVTFGDSLDECGGESRRPNLAPTPVTSPDYRSFNVFSGNNSPLEEPESVGYLTYAETQIFGGLSLEDIASVSIPVGVKLGEGLEERLRARGIAVNRYEGGL